MRFKYIIKGFFPLSFMYQAVNIYVVRKNFESNGLSLKEGETVQMISVMPDGCHWKIATMKPPYKDGLIPADLLCPELLNQSDEHAAPQTTSPNCIVMGSTKDSREPMRVLHRFTQPPTTKKPKPKPRTTTPNSAGLYITVRHVNLNGVSYSKGHTRQFPLQLATQWRCIREL